MCQPSFPLDTDVFIFLNYCYWVWRKKTMFFENIFTKTKTFAKPYLSVHMGAQVESLKPKKWSKISWHCPFKRTWEHPGEIHPLEHVGCIKFGGNFKLRHAQIQLPPCLILKQQQHKKIIADILIKSSLMESIQFCLYIKNLKKKFALCTLYRLQLLRHAASFKGLDDSCRAESTRKGFSQRIYISDRTHTAHSAQHP